MTARATIALLSLTLTCTLIALPLMAAIQAREFVGALRTAEGETLAIRDGELILVKSPTNAAASAAAIPGDATRGSESTKKRADKIARREPGWRISAPFLANHRGQFLSRDSRANESDRLILADAKSDSAKWTIEILQSYQPENPKTGSRDERQMLVGQSGSRFRLAVFDGPKRGWYLAAFPDTRDTSSNVGGSSRTVVSHLEAERADADSGETAVVVRKLGLVQDVRQALVFEYVDTKFEIRHK